MPRTKWPAVQEYISIETSFTVKPFLAGSRKWLYCVLILYYMYIYIPFYAFASTIDLDQAAPDQSLICLQIFPGVSKWYFRTNHSYSMHGLFNQQHKYIILHTVFQLALELAGIVLLNGFICNPDQTLSYFASDRDPNSLQIQTAVLSIWKFRLLWRKQEPNFPNSTKAICIWFRYILCSLATGRLDFWITTLTSVKHLISIYIQ